MKTSRYISWVRYESSDEETLDGLASVNLPDYENEAHQVQHISTELEDIHGLLI